MTHVFDTDSDGRIFSRDCCEYHFGTPAGADLVVMVNHFKSKGYSTPGDRLGANRRRRQAQRVADIYRALRNGGAELVAVLGDFNDDPASAPSSRSSVARIYGTSVPMTVSTSGPARAPSVAGTSGTRSTTCCSLRSCSERPGAEPFSVRASGMAREPRILGRSTTR